MSLAIENYKIPMDGEPATEAVLELLVASLAGWVVLTSVVDMVNKHKKKRAQNRQDKEYQKITMEEIITKAVSAAKDVSYPEGIDGFAKEIVSIELPFARKYLAEYKKLLSKLFVVNNTNFDEVFELSQETDKIMTQLDKEWESVKDRVEKASNKFSATEHETLHDKETVLQLHTIVSDLSSVIGEMVSLSFTTYGKYEGTNPDDDFHELLCDLEAGEASSGFDAFNELAWGYFDPVLNLIKIKKK